jgi:hypothetical protein
VQGRLSQAQKPVDPVCRGRTPHEEKMFAFRRECSSNPRQGFRDVKTLTIALIVGTILAQSSVLLTAASESSAVHDLAAAKSFAFGGIGVAGIMSEGERNLRAVLQQPDASQQLQAALAHATPAGELYILVGLRRCDRAGYQKIFDSLARSDDEVEVARGCMISRKPFRLLLSQIQEGQFDDYLSRPPR